MIGASPRPAGPAKGHTRPRGGLLLGPLALPGAIVPVALPPATIFRPLSARRLALELVQPRREQLAPPNQCPPEEKGRGRARRDSGPASGSGLSERLGAPGTGRGAPSVTVNRMPLTCHIVSLLGVFPTSPLRPPICFETTSLPAARPTQPATPPGRTGNPGDLRK